MNKEVADKVMDIITNPLNDLSLSNNEDEYHWRVNSTTHELETYINKVREESYQEGYNAKMKIEPNYKMFNLIQTMFSLHGDMFMKWWEKEGCNLFSQSIKEKP